jgi:hypothetical protein
LNSYRIGTVLLSVKSPLAAALKETPRWSPVYDDGVAIVFRSREKLAPAAKSVVSLDNGTFRGTSTRKQRVAVSRNPNLNHQKEMN